MKQETRLRHKWANNEVAYTMFMGMASPDLVELAAIAGFDCVRIDCHHGNPNLETLQNMIRAAELHNVEVWVRTFNDTQRILSIMDMGADGVLIPDISTAEEAEKAVKAAKFYPLGERGLYTNTRPSVYGTQGGSKYVEWANEHTIVGIQIESKEGIENIDEILSVPGIDYVAGGPNDLSQSYGVPGQKTHPLVKEAVAKIKEAAKRHGVEMFSTVNPFSENPGEKVKKLVEGGCRLINVGTDISMINATYAEMLKKLNSEL